MKALLIGGTGNISLYITRRLIELGWDVTLINRGNRRELAPRAHQIICDIEDEDRAAELLSGHRFDVVAQFIAYTPDQIARDIRLFRENAAIHLHFFSIRLSKASVHARHYREHAPV